MQLIVTLTTAAALAAAATVAPAHAQDATPEPVEKSDADAKPEKPKGTPDLLEFGARVYVRDTLTGIDAAADTVWLEDRRLDTVRAFLVFRPNKRTRMDVEVDFAGDQAELKDTF